MVTSSKELMEPGSRVRLSLSALIYREDEWWIAHCLEMDVPAEGSTPDEALKNLTELISFQIDGALAEGDLQSIFSFAPPELWKSFAVANDWIQRKSLQPVPSPVEHLRVRSLSATSG